MAPLPSGHRLKIRPMGLRTRVRNRLERRLSHIKLEVKLTKAERK